MNNHERYGSLTDEEQAKLDLCANEAMSYQRRKIRCPRCNFVIEEVYSDCTGHIDIYCRKCKLVGTINLAYYRKNNRHRSYFYDQGVTVR